jgi:nucleoside 2-deoxyribosyltransferase
MSSNEQTKCFFCGTDCQPISPDQKLVSPKEIRKYSFLGNFYRCPVCGIYGIDEIINSSDVSNDKKIKISHLLAERDIHKKSGVLFHVRAENIPQITVNCQPLQHFEIETFLKDYPKDVVEMLDRAFLNFSSYFSHPCDRIILSSGNVNGVRCLDTREYEQVIRLLFIDYFQINSMVVLFSDNNWIKLVNPNIPTQTTINITPHGWQHLRELKKRPAGDTIQAFVAMWFHEDRNPFYAEIEKACLETGYKALRIDNKEHNEKICDQIIAEIRKSRILIADMTGNRGGVYYEAGFAFGLGLPVIYIVDRSDIDKLHFDTRQYNHIVYENKADLYEKLKHRIEATVPITEK